MKVLLRNVPLRRFILGRLITNAGDSLYVIGTLWLVHELGGSSLYTGLAGFLVFLPGAFQFLMGPLADRWPIKRVLVGTQLVQCGMIALIPLASVLGVLNIPLVLIVVPLAGMVNQLLYPTQNRALPQLVDDDDLASANSILSLTYEGVDAAFNAIGGLLIAMLGAVTLYVIDVVSFAAVALIFASIPIPNADPAKGANGSGETETTDQEANDGYLQELDEGFGYVFGSVFGVMTVLMALVNFAYGGMIAVLPEFADVRGGAGLFGLLMGSLAAGRFVGALLGPRFRKLKLSSVMIVGFSLGAIIWAVGILVDWVPVALVALGLAMIPMGIVNVLQFTFLQTHAPGSMLGRASSISGSVSAVAVPLGALVGGIVSDLLVVDVVAVMLGVAAFRGIVALVWLIHPELRGMPAIQNVNPGRYGLRSQDQG